MNTSLWLVVLVAITSDIVVFLASVIWLKNKRLTNLLAIYATPFAAGALLSAAFIDFLHDGVERYNASYVLLSALVGILLFFVLEGWLHWFHHHSKQPFEKSHTHSKSTDPIITLAASGNWLHNFIDGAAIAAAFLISPATGLITTIAVGLHEIPREIADSGYLIKRGLSVKSVIMVHALAIVATMLGVLIFYNLGNSSNSLLGILIGSTAGFFIYIAASDIIPNINKQRQANKIIDTQTALVIVGATIVGFLIYLTHYLIG